MNLKEIKAKAKCCVSDKPLSSSFHLNFVALDKIATWKYPTHGNVIKGTSGLAIAIVHDEHFPLTAKGQIKYAIEIRDTEIIYHPVESLKSSITQNPKIHEN